MLDPHDTHTQLDDAAALDERRHTSTTSLYTALLGTLPVEDRLWVIDVVARHAQTQAEADRNGDTLSGPVW